MKSRNNTIAVSVQNSIETSYVKNNLMKVEVSLMNYNYNESIANDATNNSNLPNTKEDKQAPKKEFVLDKNFRDKQAFRKLQHALDLWEDRHDDHEDVRIKDIMMEICPEEYTDFTPGDCKRVGKAFSEAFEEGLYPEFERGKPHGATNTYHLVNEDD